MVDKEISMHGFTTDDNTHFACFTGSFLLQGVPEDVAVKLFRQGEVYSVPKGTEILHEGEEPRHLYVVLDGELEAYLPKAHGRVSRVRLARLGNGQCVGEYGFVDHQPVFANAKALKETVLFHISYDNFERFLAQHQDAGCALCRNLIVELVRRLRAENETLDLFAFPSTA